MRPVRKKPHYSIYPVEVKTNSTLSAMQAILLAAGFGTRLRPYTEIRPKPLFPVLNQPLLHRLLGQLAACDCYPVLVNCHHLADHIEAALVDWPEVELQVEPEILGTGGALRLGLERMENDPLLVMNGDLYHDIDLEALFNYHLMSQNDVTMALHDYPRFNSVAVEGDRVRDFGKGSMPGRLAFTGIHVIDPEALERIAWGSGYYDIIDLYRQLAQEGKIGFKRVDGSNWCDIGTPADYLSLHGRLLAEEEKPWRIAPSARVAMDAELDGWGCVGPDAVIGSGAQLTNCVVWPQAVVPEGVRASEMIITGNAEIDSTGWGR